MKKTTRKRSPSKKANEGGYLLGRGSAGRAAKKVQARKSSRKSRMDSIMKEIKKSRR